MASDRIATASALPRNGGKSAEPDEEHSDATAAPKAHLLGGSFRANGSERGNLMNALQGSGLQSDCRVAALLAMTGKAQNRMKSTPKQPPPLKPTS